LASSECKITLNKSYGDSTVLLEISEQGVANIILNRPDKHNSLDNAMISGLSDLLDELYDYLDNKKYLIKILVLKANGKSFCAGADLKHMQEMVNYSYDENYNDAMELAEVLFKLANFPCPTIAMVNGSAYGGGVGLICCMDFAYAVTEAEFCLSEVKLGLIPAVISPYIINTCGVKKAKRIMLSAYRISSTEALEYDILSHIVASQNELKNSVDKLISDLLNNGPNAMIAVKKLVSDYNHISDSMNNTVEAIANIRVSAEGQEGLLAFLSKRKPSWVIN